MIDQSSREEIIKLVNGYVSYVANNIDDHIAAEKYKFDALRHFQDTFDLESQDIAGNLKNALSKVGNLAVGAGYYPLTSIYDIASNQPEETRDALRLLFAEGDDIDRFSKFQEVMAPLSQRYSTKTTSYPYNMDLRFMSLLLSLYDPSKWINFKPTQVDAAYLRVYGEKTGTRANDANRVIKARNLGVKILEELNNRPEFDDIRRTMGYGDDSQNLWFAQDVIWQSATNNGGGMDKLKELLTKYMADNPDWRDSWGLNQDQIVAAIAEFSDKFNPDRLRQMSDEEVLRWLPYRQDSTNDTLSYYLEFSPVVGKMGGIGGGSAAKMGYYQGKDGQWKKFQNNAVTTKEDALAHRKIDIEVLSDMYKYISNDDFDGLKAYTDSLNDAAQADTDNNISILDSHARYRAVLPALVWVRKYFAVLFPDKFIYLYGSKYVTKLEAVANTGSIEGGGKQWDQSAWYSQMNKIAAVGPELNVTNYELSSLVWGLVSQAEDIKEPIMEEALGTVSPRASLNTIIYGPPGTGKTYSINGIRRDLIDDQHRESIDPLEGITTWGDAILRVFTENDYQPLSVNEITKSQTMQAYAATRNSKTPYGTISTQILGNATEDSTNSAYRLGTDKFQKTDGKWSLTEIGRAEADELNSVLQSEQNQTGDTDHFFKFITFHQSYGYEEFIEGIRPETDESGQLLYGVRDGVFKTFCRRAEDDPSNKYLFVIDEINRGNISKIFGELITLLEPNKRLGASEAMTTTLPYSGEKFGVPKNVYVVGTMNTADRSIALLDIALRRRFDFKEIMPKPSLLSDNIDGVNLQRLLSAINAKVAEDIDRNHQIGHSYLMEISSTAELHNAWYQRIIPLLQEYFYDDKTDLRSILRSFVDKDEIVSLEDEEFRQALIGIYEEAQTTDS